MAAIARRIAQQLAVLPIRFDSQARAPKQATLLEVRNYYDPERRSAVNIVPGLDGMPAAAQNIAEFLPLTYFNRLIRGIVLRGVDITSMLDELLALAIFTAVAFTLAILKFSKRLD